MPTTTNLLDELIPKRRVDIKLPDGSVLQVDYVMYSGRTVVTEVSHGGDTYRATWTARFMRATTWEEFVRRCDEIFNEGGEL